MPENSTEEQSAVIHAPLDTHIKVVAVAGSGKSTTLRQRVRHLLAGGMQASSILVLMFNKSAQIEFDMKLKALYPQGALPQTRTYHSLGFRLCNSLSKKGLLPAFKLNTSANGPVFLGKQALKMAVGKLHNSPCNPSKPGVVEAFVSYIDLVKSGLLSPEETFDSINIDPKLSPFIQGFEIFEKLRHEKQERFFSDLIFDPVKHLLNSDESRSFVTNRLRQIIVDEYQDINSISQELIKILSGNTAYVTAVGDDDQCLYGFRGSKPEYLINRFDNDFEDATIFQLSNTFRYGHTIALASNNVIANNSNRVNKLCVSADSTPSSVVEMRTEPKSGTNKESGSANQEAIVNPIIQWKEEGNPLKEIAVLLRLFSMSPPIELAFMRAGIPYRIEGRPSVFDVPEVSALIGLLRLADGSLFGKDEAYIKDVIYKILLLPHPGISQSIIQELSDQIAKDPDNLVSIVAIAAARQQTFIGTRVNRKAEAITTLQERKDWTPTEALTMYIEMTECFKNIKDMSLSSEDADTLISAIEAFIDYCGSKQGSIAELVTEIELLRAAQHANSKKHDAVLITSVHRSKGLEWPMVILPKLAESYFPYIREDGDLDIQSERRLFYVAMTRAIKKLVLVVPYDEQLAKALQFRNSMVPVGLYGNKERASRFVYEANLKPCIELGKTLYSNASFSSMDTIGEPELFNQYLTKVGAQFRLSKPS
jgi:DNA helicase II / ATP-dependent DNA helicase PcrA